MGRNYFAEYGWRRRGPCFYLEKEVVKISERGMSGLGGVKMVAKVD